MTVEVNPPDSTSLPSMEEQYPMLVIPWAPVLLNEWAALGPWGRARLCESLYPVIAAVVSASSIKSVPVPCEIYSTVYLHGRARWSSKAKKWNKYAKIGDAQNRLTALDKVIIDSLTEPRGRKKRGVGLIPDDSPKYLTLMVPEVILNAPDDKTVLVFKPRNRQPREARGHHETDLRPYVHGRTFFGL